MGGWLHDHMHCAPLGSVLRSRMEYIFFFIEGFMEYMRVAVRELYLYIYCYTRAETKIRSLAART